MKSKSNGSYNSITMIVGVFNLLQPSEFELYVQQDHRYAVLLADHVLLCYASGYNKPIHFYKGHF